MPHSGRQSRCSCFLALVLYLKVPGMIGKMLDGRIKAIETELAEAERLRLEAKFSARGI